MTTKPSPRKTAAKPASNIAEAVADEFKSEKKRKKEKKEPNKLKVVRDSFTMPQADYDLIAALKQKALKAGLHVKKSELLRASLKALDKLSSVQLKRSLTALEKIKTGRPKKA